MNFAQHYSWWFIPSGNLGKLRKQFEFHWLLLPEQTHLYSFIPIVWLVILITDGPASKYLLSPVISMISSMITDFFCILPSFQEVKFYKKIILQFPFLKMFVISTSLMRLLIIIVT